MSRSLCQISPCWVLVPLVALVAQFEVDAEEGADRGPAPVVGVFPEIPRLSLAKPRAVEPEPDSQGYWTAKAAKAVEAAENTDEPLLKSRHLLAAANIILAHQLEPACSLAVHGLEEGESRGPAETIIPLLEKSGELISQAQLLLGAMQPKKSEAKEEKEEPISPEPSPPELVELLHTAETLQSFANGQRAYLLGDVEPGARRRAASALAPLLEDPNRQVASAARLWQALLRDSDPAAAIHILESPMSPPPPDTWPYGLFARVLRCRYQGAQGLWSTALLMLVHIEEKLNDWVPEAGQRGDTRRFFQLTRLRVLKAWHDAIPPEQATERAWCVRQAQQAIQVYFSVETSLVRLEPAIPIVVSMNAQKPGDEKAAPE